jgi:hypothetical protein
MKQAMIEGRRILSDNGRSIVVFAHKSTAGWEAQLQAMIDAGWSITASWSIDTEMSNRLRAMDSAALASSIHLVCRPRVGNPIGNWRDVMEALPVRINRWLPRLAKEGVVGADAIFACLGPALEIFSQYAKVEKANGEIVTLREYLEVVWGVISKEALSMIFEDADAAGLEEDARLTCIWLWTLFGPSDNNIDKISLDDNIDEIIDEDDNNETANNTKIVKTKTSGFSLEFDAARKIAQGLGVHLETLNSLVQIKGSTARLYSVEERVQFLFRKSLEDVASAKQPADSTVQKGSRKKQTNQDANLFDAVGGIPDMPEDINAPLAFAPGTTVLDRIHQCMLLFGAGRSDAIRRFLVDEKHGNDARFWKLAQSLSALYPPNSAEKRWLDGILAKKKGLGL